MNIIKSMTKIIAVGIAGMLMGSCIMASTNKSENKVLTLERAISGGIDKEEKKAVFSKQILAYNEQLKGLSDLSSVQYYNIKYAKDEAEQQKEFIKDVVEYNVTVLYDAILMLQKQIQLREATIELKQKELKQAEIKNNKGQLSEIDLTLKKSDLERFKSQLLQDQLTLANYKTQFLNLTNINIDQYDELEEDLVYEPLGDQRQVQGMITRNVDSYMKNAEDFLAYKKDNIITLAQEQTITGPSMDVVYNVEAQVAESAYNTEQRKKQMIEGLKTCAIELEKLEEKLKIDLQAIANEKIKAEAIKIKYEKGYASALALNQIEQSILEFELAYEQDFYTYKHQKMILEKPWVKY